MFGLSLALGLLSMILHDVHAMPAPAEPPSNMKPFALKMGEKRRDPFSEGLRNFRTQEPMECWNATWTNNLEWLEGGAGYQIPAMAAGVWMYSAYHQYGPRPGETFYLYEPLTSDHFYTQNNKLVLKVKGEVRMEPLLINNMAFDFNSLKIWPIDPKHEPVQVFVTVRGYDNSFGGNLNFMIGEDGKWGHVDFQAKIAETVQGAIPSNGWSLLSFTIGDELDPEWWYIDDIVTRNACELTRFYDIQECAPTCKREYIAIGEDWP